MLETECRTRLSRLAQARHGLGPEPHDCFEVAALLGELSSYNWSGEDFLPERLDRLRSSVRELRGQYAEMLAEPGSAVDRCVNKGLMEAFSSIMGNLETIRQSLASLHQYPEGYPMTTVELPIASVEIDHDLLLPLDRLAYALELARDVGVRVSPEVATSVGTAESEIRGLLTTFGPLYEKSGDSLYPEYPERFPDSFWWRRQSQSQ